MCLQVDSDDLPVYPVCSGGLQVDYVQRPVCASRLTLTTCLCIQCALVGYRLTVCPASCMCLQVDSDDLPVCPVCSGGLQVDCMSSVLYVPPG